MKEIIKLTKKPTPPFELIIGIDSEEMQMLKEVKRAYERGFAEGIVEGALQGYKVGKQSGYDKGYEDGYDDGCMDLIDEEEDTWQR